MIVGVAVGVAIAQTVIFDNSFVNADALWPVLFLSRSLLNLDCNTVLAFHLQKYCN